MSLYNNTTFLCVQSRTNSPPRYALMMGELDCSVKSSLVHLKDFKWGYGLKSSGQSMCGNDLSQSQADDYWHCHLGIYSNHID